MRILNEALAAKFAYAYHRTHPDNVPGIIAKGFEPRYGDMYGKGWYMCFDLDSQLRSGMTHYGAAIIKCRVNMKGVLVLDYKVAKQIYGQNYRLMDQVLKVHKIYRHKSLVPPVIKLADEVLEQSFTYDTYSAAIAGHSFVGGKSPLKVEPTGSGMIGRPGTEGTYSILDPSTLLPEEPEIRGLVFTGNHDGNVLLVYTPQTVIPYQYCVTEDDGVTYSTEWTSVLERKAIQRAKTAETIIEEYGGKIKFLDLGTMSVDQFQADYPWLKKADFANAKINITPNPSQPNGYSFTWVDGTWKRGKWYGDLWLNGEWMQGVWYKGTFDDGTWKSGRFLDGYFGGATGYPVWKKGIWEAPYSQWIEGTWNGGKVVTNRGKIEIEENPKDFFMYSADYEQAFTDKYEQELKGAM